MGTGGRKPAGVGRYTFGQRFLVQANEYQQQQARDIPNRARQLAEGRVLDMIVLRPFCGAPVWLDLLFLLFGLTHPSIPVSDRTYAAVGQQQFEFPGIQQHGLAVGQSV